MRHEQGTPGLHALARLHGIQTAYRDVAGRHVSASDATLTALLRSLGVPVENAADCRNAARDERLRRCEQLIEPVLVAWDGSLSPFNLWLRADEAKAVNLSITGEDGAPMPFEGTSVNLQETGFIECNGQQYRSLLVHIHTVLPTGYHNLLCEAGARSAHAHVLSAPSHVYQPAGAPQRQWGVFLPLYALRTAADWGAGSYADLARLVEWTAHEGGSLVGTLPLLPCFHGPSDEASPYLPVTRLLWSEFFADIESAPNLAACPEALHLLQSRQGAQAREALRRSGLVDYAEVWRLK
ncbi:MAG: 4-alpha-glucanotransferase, partial [Dehalococcoidia bacterium]|nr:4-alpha-glucanotransferase [Dehalococcoidia bacterium]